MLNNQLKAIKGLRLLFFSSLLSLYSVSSNAQPSSWHGIHRVVRYTPDGSDFVIKNGNRRFNRAIYGTNTAFRVEAGDKPEFALYLPGMGGNLKLGIIKGTQSKWLIDAENIEARYRPGSMLYTIHDPLLGKGTIKLQLLAGAKDEALLLKADVQGIDTGVELFWAYGGATGKKFSRDGDIGADPESSFYLKPEYCVNNTYQLTGNRFSLNFSAKATTEATRYENEQSRAKKNETVQSKKLITGIFPASSVIKLADADQQSTPSTLMNLQKSDKPVICGTVKALGKPLYWLLGSGTNTYQYADLPRLMNDAETARQVLTSRVQLKTPDAHINTLGGALAIAADAIWEDPSYMHGAVAWRMRLPAWRGAYVADPLGWHDRAWKHFSSYALSQILTPESGPIVADTALHLARQQEKLGNAMFSSGYISRNPNGDIRPHHYDMNLVFIDQMLTHFNWTGDLTEVKKLWPTIKRHLAWEKRNYDHDGDGLYDAYCAIWASDALQYSGGGVTHSSAYNYRANKMAAQLAKLMGDDPKPYEQEAIKIERAVAAQLWMRSKGTYAEFKDLLGNKLLHTTPGVWTIYHAIDEGLPNAFQTYQSLRYIDNEIPHIPVQARGLSGNYEVLSTTNWLPYTWSLNNVAMAENMHTALAYWQGNRADKGFNLWKSMLIESMYLGASPGNFQQLSFYDAIRGELYRDFADPVGMSARALVEGLFGIKPNLFNGTLTIKPGFPAEWKYASLKVPDIKFDFKSNGNVDSYTISSALPKATDLLLQLRARTTQIKAITVNGQPVNWQVLAGSVGSPVIEVNAGKQKSYVIKVIWAGTAPDDLSTELTCIAGNTYTQTFHNASVLKISDPQSVLASQIVNGKQLKFSVKPVDGKHTAFVQLKQGALTWWQPMNLDLHANAVAVKFSVEQPKDEIRFNLYNYGEPTQASVQVNPELSVIYNSTQQLKGAQISDEIVVPAANLITGSNHIRVTYNGHTIDTTIINWNIANTKPLRQVNMISSFNDELNHIFTNQYLSPRPQSVTLQLPTQGIGNWCYPLTTAEIDDSGLRKVAGAKNMVTLDQKLIFATPGSAGKNIAFTSQWDNYPRSISIPLSGSAAHAYLLMAGSTNPMQSRMVNGEVTVHYADGTSQTLQIKNPENWWPIEQDYDNDGQAFNPGAAKPLRISFKSGQVLTDTTTYKPIKGYSNKGIEGGAASVLDLCLDPSKTLKNLELKTITNDVVIGLMGITLLTNDRSN